MGDLYQIVLPNGRGVRARILTPTQCDAALVDAAKLVGQDATNVAINTARVHECVKAMLHSVTERTGLTLEDLNKPETKWIKLDGQKLETDDKLGYDKLFGPKDDSVLVHLYNQNHTVTRAEAEAIVGKAQPVSVD